MVALVALLVAAAVPAEEHDLWLDALGAPLAPQHPAAVAHWRWSPRCSPVRIASEDSPVPCRGETVRITVVNPAGEPLPGVHLRWGPAAMRQEVPENLLPTAVTAPDGAAQLLAPPGERLWVRVSGPAWASPWREVPSRHQRITVSAGEEVDLTEAGPGWTRVECWPHGERLWGLWVIPPGEHLRVWVPAGFEGTAVAWGHEAPPFATVISSRTVLTPPPAASVEAQVSDPEGQPVAQVEVSTLVPVPGVPRAVLRHCRTGDDGSCTLAGVPAGPTTLNVVKSGWVPRRVAIVVEPPSATVRVPLDRGRPGTVKVRSATGGPVAGAEVFLKPSHVVLGSTDAAGVAKLAALPADEAVNLGISAEGYVEGSAVLGVEEQAVDVVLTPAVRITGTVAFADGTLPPGGTVVLEWADGTLRDEPLPGSGRIELDGLPPGRLAVELRADGAVPLLLPQRELHAGETWDVGTVVLERGATVTGTVVGRESGEGIANARLRLPRPHQFGPRLSALRGDFVETLSGEGGVFELRGVPTGGHPILVEAPGFAPRLVREVVVRAQEQTPVDVGTVALDKDLVLEVYCTPADRCGDRALVLLGGEANDWAFLEERMTDGRARFASVPADDLTVQLRARSIVRATRTVTVSPKDKLTVVEVTLETGRVEGVVRWDGRPAGEGVVELREQGSPSPPAVIFSSAPPGAAEPSTQTILGSAPEELEAPVDGEGKFVFASVPPGLYQATVRGPWGVSPQRPVSVLADATTTVVLDFPGGRVVGEVVDTQGLPQEEGSVDIFTGSSLLGSTSIENGHFTMGGLAPGEYLAVARTVNGSGRSTFSCRSGELAHVRIVVESESPPETEARVTDWNGRPAAGAMVLGLTAAGWRLGFTDGAGVARPSGHQLLAAAAFRADLGFAAAPCPPSRTCELAFSSAAGTLEVLEPPDAAVAVNHGSGVPLHLLAGAAGLRWVTPCRIPGLPAGSYSVTVGDGPPRTVVVRARQTTTVGR